MLHTKAIYSAVLGCIALAIIVACGNEHEGKSEQEVKTSLELSLDSAQAVLLLPEAGKIVGRVRNKILHEQNQKVRVKGLRILSSVLLLQDRPSRAELDSAVSFVAEAEKLSIGLGDSVEWALCTVQLFRYKAQQRVRGFIATKIGTKTDLQSAIRILKHYNLKDDLSIGYRVLARSMIIDNEERSEILNYELLSLQCNDSLKYPFVRARICADIAIDYHNFFKEGDLSEKFYLRAIGILRLSGNTLDHSKALYNLGEIVTDTNKSLRYLWLAANVAKAGRVPESEMQAYFLIAEKYQSIGTYDSALYYSRKAIRMLPAGSEAIVHKEAVMARSYIGVGQRQRAKHLMQAREQVFKNRHFESYDFLAHELEQLVDAYDALGDYQKLAEVQNSLLVLRDSLFSKNRMIEVGRVENRYELELKNKELKVLQMSNELHASEAKRGLWVRFLLLAVAVIATLGLLIVLILLKQQNQLNKSLEEQNSIIEQQKIDLESSLQELQKAQAHVLTSEKMAMLGQFTAGVAHELNNPLNFISGGVSVLEEAADNAGNAASEEDHRILRNIRNGVDRAIAIVNSLRVFSNPRSEIGFDSQSDIAECLNASLLVLQSKIRKEEITMVTDFSEGLVVGHSGQLCQVFINLIDNAIHAVKDMPKGQKTVEIKSRKSDGYLFVDIRDSGTGVPSDAQENLFRAFFTTKPTGQGIGLGLFICEAIVRGIGGSIMFTSKDNQGATFTVQFPCPA